MECTVKAMLHSQDRDGLHRADLQEVTLLEQHSNNDCIIRIPDGTVCHAVYNIFCGHYFADDVYGIIEKKPD